MAEALARKRRAPHVLAASYANAVIRFHSSHSLASKGRSVSGGR
jgi:hypothetical protein